MSKAVTRYVLKKKRYKCFREYAWYNRNRTSFNNHCRFPVFKMSNFPPLPQVLIFWQFSSPAAFKLFHIYSHSKHTLSKKNIISFIVFHSTPETLNRITDFGAFETSQIETRRLKMLMLDLNLYCLLLVFCEASEIPFI